MEKIKTLKGDSVDIEINSISARKINNFLSSYLKTKNIKTEEAVLEETGEIDKNGLKVFKIISPKSTVIDIEGSDIFKIREKMFEAGVKGITIDEIDSIEFNKVIDKHFSKYLDAAISGTGSNPK